MKNINFNEQINLFLKKKNGQGNLAMRTQESAYACSFLHAYVGLILCTHGKF